MAMRNSPEMKLRMALSGLLVVGLGVLGIVCYKTNLLGVQDRFHLPGQQPTLEPTAAALASDTATPPPTVAGIETASIPFPVVTATPKPQVTTFPTLTGKAPEATSIVTKTSTKTSTPVVRSVDNAAVSEQACDDNGCFPEPYSNKGEYRPSTAFQYEPQIKPSDPITSFKNWVGALLGRSSDRSAWASNEISTNLGITDTATTKFYNDVPLSQELEFSERAIAVKIRAEQLPSLVVNIAMGMTQSETKMDNLDPAGWERFSRHFNETARAFGISFHGEDGKIITQWLKFSSQDDVKRVMGLEFESFVLARDLTKSSPGQTPEDPNRKGEFIERYTVTNMDHPIVTRHQYAPVYGPDGKLTGSKLVAQEMLSDKTRSPLIAFFKWMRTAMADRNFRIWPRATVYTQNAFKESEKRETQFGLYPFGGFPLSGKEGILPPTPTPTQTPSPTPSRTPTPTVYRPPTERPPKETPQGQPTACETPSVRETPVKNNTPEPTEVVLPTREPTEVRPPNVTVPPPPPK